MKDLITWKDHSILEGLFRVYEENRLIFEYEIPFSMEFCSSLHNV